MNGKPQEFYDCLMRNQAMIYLVIVCLVVIGICGKNIFDDEVFALNGDEARYLMNGVYLLDVLRDVPIGNFIEYSMAYYSRYPALSIGHHPPLTSMFEIPFFAIFGISVFSGKLTILCIVLVGCIMWFRLIRDRYDEHIAFLSTLLFITTPFIVKYSIIVMSEMPALALMIAAAYYFQQYLAAEKRQHLILFLVSFAMSVYAKQLAVILGLAFAWEFVARKGFRKIFEQDVLWSGVVFFIAMLPIGAMSFGLSPANIVQVSSVPMDYIVKSENLFQHARMVWLHHLTSPVVWLSVAGIVIGLWRRDQRCYFFLAWILAFYGVLTYTGIGQVRFGIFWIPAFCLFAANFVNVFSSRYWRIGITTVILVISGSQAIMAYNVESTFARGYQEAAQYVVQNKKGASVLYSAHVDTGYFIFNTRALDSNREMIVLLADKVLATTNLTRFVEERIQNKDDIYTLLKDFGVCHVVLEDKPSESHAIEWLRKEVKKEERFTLKKNIPIHSNHKRLQNVSLKIYEYKSCGPSNPNAVLDMNLPLINRSIKIRFDKLEKGM